MNTINILFIEDSTKDTLLIVREIESKGYKIIYERVDAGKEMIKALHEKEWDLIISDYSLKDFTALEALKILQKSQISLPFILAYSSIDEDLAIDAMRAGAKDYINKDNLKRLTPIIERELRETKKRRQREKTEEALRVSEERYRSLAEASQDLIFIIDRTDKVLYVNNFAAKQLNMTPEQIIGMSRDRFFPPNISERQKKSLDIVFDTGKSIRKEDPIIYKDQKSEVWIDTALVPIKNKDGQVDAVVGISRDITKRKLSEKALEDSEARNRAILNAIPDIMFLFSRSGVYLDYYAGLPELLFLPPENFINKDINETLPEKIAQAAKEAIVNALETGKVQKIEYSINIKNKTQFFESRIVACDNDRAMAIVRDITERKKLESQLQQAQKLESLGVLAGGIAHDFNNILTSIVGYADILLSELPHGNTEREFAQQIITSAKRASDLTKQMLAYSGKGKFFVQPLDISRVVEDISQLIGISISKKCKLKFNFAKNLPLIEGDMTQIRQVIMNILINASEAIGDRTGKITVTTKAFECDRDYLSTCYLNEELPEGLYVSLEVEDTGSGIPEKIKRKIFDPFFSTKFTGRGLGLAAVMGIVRSHKGAIRIYTEDNKGTNFKVIFPASKLKKDEVFQKKIDYKQKTFSGTLLLVDDEETVLKVAKTMLSRLGFTVITAPDGKKAIDIFLKKKDQINAVLLDMTMPVMDGKETFFKLKKIRKNIPVILSSGYNKKDTVKKFGFGEVLAGFIQKPYRLQELIKTLEIAMSG